MATITVRRQSHSKQKQLVLAVASVLVALTVATGIGAWQSGDRSTTSTAREQTAPASAPVTSSSNSGSSSGSRDIATGSRASASTPTGQTVYLVATTEAAAQLWAAINIAPDRSGYQVMVLDPATDSTVLGLIHEMNALRSASGLPPTTIIDTRGQ